MNIEVNSTVIKREVTEYPCLGVNKYGDFVLFHEESRGIVLVGGNSDWQEGDYSTKWNMCEFSLYQGSVTISND